MKNKLYKKFIHTLAKAKIKSIKKKAEKKILKRMKEEGRQKFEQRSKCTDKI